MNLRAAKVIRPWVGEPGEGAQACQMGTWGQRAPTHGSFLLTRARAQRFYKQDGNLPMKSSPLSRHLKTAFEPECGPTEAMMGVSRRAQSCRDEPERKRQGPWIGG
jgi:hypothetical protein